MAGSGISPQTKKALVDLGLDENPATRGAAPKPRATGGDVTKQISQADYDAKVATQKARSDAAYAKYKRGGK